MNAVPYLKLVPRDVGASDPQAVRAREGNLPPAAALHIPVATFSRRHWSTFLRKVVDVRVAKGEKSIVLSTGAAREIADLLEFGGPAA